MQSQDPVKAHQWTSEAASVLAPVPEHASASVLGRASVQTPAQALEEVPNQCQLRSETEQEVAQLQEPANAHGRASEVAVALASGSGRASVPVLRRAWVGVPAWALEEALEEVPHRACARRTQYHVSEEPPDVRRGVLRLALPRARARALRARCIQLCASPKARVRAL